MANEALIAEINKHLQQADSKLLKSMYWFITRTISFEHQEGTTQIAVDIISDGTVSWRICGQQHWANGGETEGFLFDKTLREVCDSEIGQDIGLIYEDVLRGLGWHDEATYQGLPPHAQKTIKHIA